MAEVTREQAAALAKVFESGALCRLVLRYCQDDRQRMSIIMGNLSKGVPLETFQEGEWVEKKTGIFNLPANHYRAARSPSYFPSIKVKFIGGPKAGEVENMPFMHPLPEGYESVIVMGSHSEQLVRWVG